MIRHRLEVWTRDGSKRRAIFGSLYRAERRQVLQGEEVLTAEISAQDDALSSLVSGSVLRLQREGVATDATLWRLTARGKARDQSDALRYQITADALWMDLRQGMVRQRLVDGRSQYTFGLNGLTPQQWLEDFILPGYEGTAVGFRLGTVEISEPVDLTFERSNPLAALRMLEGAADAEAQFRLDPSGEFYWLDFLERVGSTQGTAELRYGKNLVGLERFEDETDVETRLYAVGSGLLTLADAEWKIGSLSGTTAARVITFDGPSPVIEDGAFVGLWFNVPAKGRYPITASVKSTGRLTVNASGLPALSAGDVGHLITDIDGTRLAYLESPAGVGEYTVRVGDYAADDVPDAVNAVPNSDLSAWSGGLPTGWTKLGTPTVTQEADRLYVHQGERAARIVASEGDEGLISPAFDLSNPADRPYTALLAGLTLISGSVRIELRRQGGEIYPIGERPVLIDLGIYSTMTAGPVHDEPLPAGTYQVAVVSHGGAAEWVLDCAMVTPVIGEEVPAYVAGSGAHLLWERTAWELDERRRPRVEWRIDIADLYRVDPEAFRFDELRMGDSVPVRDPEFPRARPRIVELIQDILDARATQVVLADSARMRVHDPFRPPNPALGGRRAGIGRRSTGTEGAAVMAVQRQWDAATKRLTLGAIGTPVVATLELRTRTSPDDPWTLHDTIAGRQGWFDPIQDPADDLLYQVTPRDGRGVAGEAVEDTWARGAEGPPGPEGPEGPPGLSIRWRGEFPAPPGSPQINDVYRNTTDGIVYIYTGAQWEVMTHDGDDGADGAQGQDGWRVYITYHDSPADSPPAAPTGNGTTDGWHTDSTPAVVWMSQKVSPSQGEGAWGTPVLIKGPQGPKGEKGDKGDPGDDAAAPPIARVVVESLTGASAQMRVTGTDAAGGTSGLQWSWRWHTLGDPLPAWGSWQSLPAAGALQQLARHAGRDRQAYFRVRDADGRISSDAVARVPAQYQAIDPDTGRIDRGTPTSDGRILEDQDGSQLRADQAEAGAINEMHDRGLKPDGFDGQVGRGAGALPALTVAQQVQEPSQNLLPPGAGALVEVPSGATRYPGGTVATRDIPLSVMGLAPGDVVSYSVRRYRTPSGIARSGIGWVDSTGEVMYYDSVPDYTSAVEARGVVEAVVIPEGAVAVRPYLGERGFGAGDTAYFRHAMLNRGPVALPFEEPPGRPGREGIDIWRGSLNPEVTRSDGSRPLVITAGTRIYEARHGADDIEFDPPFQEAPAVLVIGPKTYSKSLGHEVDQYRRWEADDVTAGGIGRVIMQLEALSGISGRTDPLTAGTLTAQGQSSALPNGLTGTSVNGRHIVNYGVAIEATAPPGLGKIDITLLVAIDTAFDGQGWVERITETYLLHAAAGNMNTLALPNESLTVVVSALKAGDNVRVRIKNIIVEEFGGAGSYSIAVAPKTVQYTIATAQRDPPDNPGVWGEPGHVIVFGAT